MLQKLKCSQKEQSFCSSTWEPKGSGDKVLVTIGSLCQRHHQRQAHSVSFIATRVHSFPLERESLVLHRISLKMKLLASELDVAATNCRNPNR